jgi:predicted acylesterase/phospholipase RssA
MKRILTLDGGGIHGVLTLQILKKIEQELAPRYAHQKSRFVLADHFHLIAGTSTGAIIASMLAWGASTEEIEQFYVEKSPEIFVASSMMRRLIYNRFTSTGIIKFLQNYFAEQDGSPALLGTARLRTLLLLVLRNATTGSPWPVTNCRDSLYNRRPPGQSNLELPLWQLIRASTAAPTFFPPQRILIANARNEQKSHQFIDGGVSPYNNPSYLAYLMATLPEYCIRFPRGTDQLTVVSVGVGQRAMMYNEDDVQDMSVISHAKATIRALMDADSRLQDILCRTTGLCLFGSELDREVKSLTPTTEEELAAARRERQFTYVRYNHIYTEPEVKATIARLGGKWDLANLKLIPVAMEAGRAYAERHVRGEHLK